MSKLHDGKLDELQELGVQGWEAVNLAAYSGSIAGVAYCVVLLKRPVDEAAVNDL